jgi:single-stranded DNA-binding protein
MIMRQGGNIVAAGRVTKDAETKRVGEKQSLMTKFGVAVADKQYANVVTWRGLAEYCAGLKKGDTVYVAGTETSRMYNEQEYKDLNADFVMRQATAVEYSDAAEPEKLKDSLPPPQEIDEDMPF